MLYTYLHYKESKDASWDVAHLYEHLVTRSFENYLESINISPGLIGSLSGDTFERVVFLKAIFYDKRVAEAYEYFMKNPRLIDRSYLPQMQQEIEAEGREVFSLIDKKALDRQLASLTESPWISNTQVQNSEIDESSPLPKAPFAIKKSAKDFHDIIIGLYADIDTLDNDEQILFLRLSAIVNDTISYAIRKARLGSYHIGLSPISVGGGIMGNMQHIRFMRAATIQQIDESAKDALATFDTTAILPLITAHFKEFGSNDAWKNHIVDYYKHTGILTSNEYIASLATPERIATIISKLKIHVRLMKKGDEEWFL